MKILTTGCVLAAWAVAAAAAPDAPGPVVLENRVLRMEIGRSPAPFVERLVHKACGRAVVDHPMSLTVLPKVFAAELEPQEAVFIELRGRRWEKTCGASGYCQ